MVNQLGGCPHPHPRQAGEFGIYSESQLTIAASVEEAEKAEATGQWDLKWHPEGEEASWVLSGRWPSRVRWWQRARCPRFWQRRPSVLGDCCRGGAYYVSTIDSDDFDLHPELLRKRDSVFPVTPKGTFRLAQFGQVLQDIEAEPEGDEEGEGKAQAEEEQAKEENQREQGSGEEEQADEEP